MEYAKIVQDVINKNNKLNARLFELALNECYELPTEKEVDNRLKLMGYVKCCGDNKTVLSMNGFEYLKNSFTRFEDIISIMKNIILKK